MSGASAQHQSLLVWAARRMTLDGFSVLGFDGSAAQGGEWSRAPSPFLLHGVRADAWGMREEDMMLSFAEAKTGRDIDTAHTRRQLRVLGFAKMKRSSAPCPLYLAVARGEAARLDAVLADTGLAGAVHIIRIHVPEILLGAASNAA